MSDVSDDLFDGDEDATTTGDSTADGSLSTGSKESKSPDKRISDLQSKADKETARANKAEARLTALETAIKNTGSEESKPPTSGDVATDAVLDMARMFAVQQFPKLATYGLSASDLGGSTPSEIARTAAELVARFEKIETQVKNRVLSENGLAPEIDGSAPVVPSRDYSKMSAEDFKKVMDAAMNQRR